MKGWVTAVRARILLIAVSMGPVAFFADDARQWIESRMAWHMLLQFPWLLASGAATALLVGHYRPRMARVWSRWDAGGLFGLVVLSGVATLWMLPVALDAALVWPSVAAAKYGSWWFAGLSIAWAWPRMANPTRLFLLGNLAWMFATAGILYAESESRLCVNYLQGEQVWTGRGLLLVALLFVGGLAREAARVDVERQRTKGLRRPG